MPSTTRVELRVLCGAMAVLLAPITAHAAIQYAVTDLGTLPGGTYSFARAINNQGEITGDADTATGPFDQHAFLYRNGEMLDLGVPDQGLRSYGEDINDQGEIAGFFYTAENRSNAFVFRNGVMNVLPTSASGYSEAHGINNSGDITGLTTVTGGDYRAFLWSQDIVQDLGGLPGGSHLYSRGWDINELGQATGGSYSQGTHAFLYSDGRMIDLGTLPGGTYSEGRAINDQGQITGEADLRAFLYSDGVMTDLGALDDETSCGYDINNAGQVVGESYVDGGALHAFLYSNGMMYDLNSLIDPAGGWSLKGARGINDAGWIVGWGTHDGQGRGYLLVPLPEPTGLAVLMTGTIVLLGCRNRGITPISHQAAESW